MQYWLDLVVMGILILFWTLRGTFLHLGWCLSDIRWDPSQNCLLLLPPVGSPACLRQFNARAAFEFQIPSCMTRIRGPWPTASSPRCFFLHRAARRASLTGGWTCAPCRGAGSLHHDRQGSPELPWGSLSSPSANAWSATGVLQCSPAFSLVLCLL